MGYAQPWSLAVVAMMAMMGIGSEALAQAGRFQPNRGRVSSPYKPKARLPAGTKVNTAKYKTKKLSSRDKNRVSKQANQLNVRLPTPSTRYGTARQLTAVSGLASNQLGRPFELTPRKNSAGGSYLDVLGGVQYRTKKNVIMGAQPNTAFLLIELNNLDTRKDYIVECRVASYNRPTTMMFAMPNGGYTTTVAKTGDTARFLMRPPSRKATIQIYSTNNRIWMWYGCKFTPQR